MLCYGSKTHLRTLIRPLRKTNTLYCLHTLAAKRSVAAISQLPPQTQQAKELDNNNNNNNLNVIDFFHPSLTSTPFHYTLNLGVSGHPKKGKILETQQDEVIYSSIQVGDDAYFKRHDALGVADGVGGWRTHTGKYNSCLLLLIYI
jgi:hypothetical protein